MLTDRITKLEKMKTKLEEYNDKKRLNSDILCEISLDIPKILENPDYYGWGDDINYFVSRCGKKIIEKHIS